MTSLAQTVSCIDGYDPDALHVDKARAAILACIAPVSQTESVPVREALGRVLAQEIVPAIDVPSHDNSAMDGYAVRFSDLEKPLKEIGTALAGKPFNGKVGDGECVRIMTGAVMPAGITAPVMMRTHSPAPTLPAKGLPARAVPISLSGLSRSAKRTA